MDGWMSRGEKSVQIDCEVCYCRIDENTLLHGLIEEYMANIKAFPGM
jgi:hypothetical protein